MTSVANYRKTTSESAMRQAIITAVELRGGRAFFVDRSDLSPSMTDMTDLILLLPSKGCVVFCELKSWRRPTTAGQRAVLDLLAECPRAEAFIVRSEPRDEHEIGYQQFMDWLTS